jgi:ribosomal protein S24E
MIPKEVKQNLLKKVEKVLNKNKEQKFLLLLVTDDGKGSATGFLSNYDNYSTLGIMEKSKDFICDKIKEEEAGYIVDKKKEKENNNEISKLSYVG